LSCDDKIRISELLIEALKCSLPIGDVADIVEGAACGERIGMAEQDNLVGGPSKGCNPYDDDFVIKFTDILWDLQEMDTRIPICAKDFPACCVELGIKPNQFGGYDLTGTQIADLIERFLGEALLKAKYRKFWFDKKTADHVTNGGNVIDTADLKFFNLINGIFPQIEEMITNNEGVVVTEIGANDFDNAATIQKQRDYDFSAIKVWEDVYFNANMKLREASGGQFLVTTMFMDKLKRELLNKDGCCEKTWDLRERGFSIVPYLGYEVKEMNCWDRLIDAFFRDPESAGDTLDRPYRVLFTTQSNLKYGGNAPERHNIDLWYDKTKRIFYMEDIEKIGAIAIDPELISIGW
jgi:hypothetical protein